MRGHFEGMRDVCRLVDLWVGGWRGAFSRKASVVTHAAFHVLAHVRAIRPLPKAEDVAGRFPLRVGAEAGDAGGGSSV